MALTKREQLRRVDAYLAEIRRRVEELVDREFSGQIPLALEMRQGSVDLLRWEGEKETVKLAL